MLMNHQKVEMIQCVHKASSQSCYTLGGLSWGSLIVFIVFPVGYVRDAEAHFSQGSQCSESCRRDMIKSKTCERNSLSKR